MNKNFVFDAYCTETEPQLPKKRKSPWEFSRYSHTVAEEHAKRKTTSIDHKISKKLRKSIDEEEDVEEREAPSSSDEEAEVSSNNEDEEEDEDIEHEQEQEEEEEEEEENADSEVFEQTENDGNDDHDDISRETGHWNGISDESDIDFTDGDNAPQLSNPKKDGNKDIVKTAGGGAPRRKKGSSGFFAPAEGASFNAKSFAELNLSRPLLKACEALGYEKPTPIQAACIPLALTGRDICGSAITGSGKTAAFGLPVLERLLFRPKRIPATRVLVLTPTRELAVQIQSMLEKLAQFTDIRCCLAVGGLSLKIQEAQLRSRPDIVVATPGRIIDHLHNSQSVGLEDLAVLIFDEADRLLDLGFSSAVEELIKLCPKRRQTMLFSATMTDGVDKLIKLSLTSPVRLSADPLTKRPSTLTEEVIKIRPTQEIKQEAILFSLCSRTFKNKVIIFSGTKQEAHRLKILFGLSGLKAAELHGNLTQAQRLDALEQFRKQEADFLIATDVAARGLDILGVETVINFACPRDITSYVHRVGRTARAGKVGCAITFVKERDRRLLKLMAKRAGSRLLSRKVAEQSVVTWAKTIEEMEEDINAIIMEEREERAMRKAEMEAAKAQNMVEHADEIYARPKRTWFESEKDKKMLAKAAKLFKEKKEDNGGTLVTSAQEGEMLERKEKRRLDYEKNLPRRKRRKLQAAREMLEDDENLDNNQHSKNSSDRRSVKTLVEIGYRKAKAAKAIAKAHESGKFKGHAKKRAQMGNRRKDEMEAGFKNDVNFKKQRGATGSRIHLGRKKSKKSFKSKSRYQRRK